MDSGFEPKVLICVECGQEFVFTANAQEYFAEKGYTEDPKRCKHCYMKHKRDKRSSPVVEETA
ncbi:MAG: zinc-ribbon domain containing protein [Candidatus Zixiibacteriota bacterium]